MKVVNKRRKGESNILEKLCVLLDLHSLFNLDDNSLRHDY